MDRLLELSTDPIFIGLMFLISLALLHYFLVYKNPLNARQWKLAEYVWVALALVSVVGVFEEARLLRTDNQLDQYREATEDKSRALENWFDVYSIYACEENGENPGMTQLCRWVKIKHSDLRLVLANEEFPADIPRNLLLGLDEIRDGLGDADKRVIEGYLQGYLDARATYIDAVEGTKYGTMSLLLISLAPLLFAVAVALKFAKVTGEYRLLRK
ncbi:MAG: hypothetical protein JJ850_07955 [Kordiimonadaceae bacterium]|nr:hypothetical protein [Kordiimonadaceae bacterium]MBO6569061.1 hypothetical protein [Kordiimonadaceae bacterium]MBO6964536.1 hypothetical protein [Kordiimonadaceae bacterium]